MSIEIKPIHTSLKPKPIRLPKNMNGIELSQGQQEAILGIALGIFADCTNAGIPFQDALAAVYLS